MKRKQIIRKRAELLARLERASGDEAAELKREIRRLGNLIGIKPKNIVVTPAPAVARLRAK